jgi:hypothetical protein
MLEPGESWIGPFQVRSLFEACLDSTKPKPPDSGSAYLVAKTAWQSTPTAESVLYIGGNTGMVPSPPRFRTRVGDLLIDALGFYTPQTGHSSGGKHLHEWCQQNHLNPLDLYIAWVKGSECHRCLENRLYRALTPVLNRVAPSSCPNHIVG